MTYDLDKCLVLGSSGMIGRAINFGIKKTKKDLNILNVGEVEKFVLENGVDSILLLSGLNLRDVEKNFDMALEVNALAVKRIADICKTHGVFLVFISSGAVFRGKLGETFNEDSLPNPLNSYGKLKYISEELIKASGCRYSIVRTGWVFGGDASGRKKFVEIASELALEGQPIFGNSKQTGSHTYVVDLVEALGGLLSRKDEGVFHVVNDGVATGNDLAKEIVSYYSSSSEILEFSEEGNKTLVRSESEALVSKRFKLRSWEDALKDYLSSILKRI